MKLRRGFYTSAVAILVLAGLSFADHGHGKHDRDDDDHYYSDRDHDEMRGYYREHDRGDDLPPGLAKRDRLPPGLERELVVRERFPRELETRVVVIPVELERRLPPPPPDCERVAIGGHIVLRNRDTKVVLDIFHFER